MLYLSDINQADVVEALFSTSRYLDDLLITDTPYFEQIVSQRIPTKLQLNEVNSSDTKAHFLELDLSITNGIVSINISDKWYDFNFEIVNLPFLTVMFLAPLPMVHTFCNLLVLQELVLMLMTSTTETYCLTS